MNDFPVDFKDVVLAHEIFHFIEEENKSLYTNTRKISFGHWENLYT